MNTPTKFMLMLVLASSVSAIAQTDMSNDSMKKGQTSGKKTSMTGCIAEKDGKYMMTNQEHPDSVQLMSSEDLKPHVGHTVKVTGMMESISGDSMKSDNKMTGGDKMKHDSMATTGMMKVGSMKMISAHCGK